MKLRLTAAHYHGGGFGELAFAIDDLGDDPLHALHSLAQRWLTGGIVTHGHAATASGMPEQPSDSRERHATTDKLGGERVAEGVSVQSGLAETQAPATEDLRDSIRREIDRFWDAWLAAPINSTAEFTALENSVDNLCRLIAERDSSRSRLAADVQRLSAQVDILRSQARQLTAAQASAQEKFEKIRVALRGADKWRGWAYRNATMGSVHIDCAYAIDQIQSLLPPKDVGPVVLSGGRGDASEMSEGS